jgi:hypothetical protein
MTRSRVQLIALAASVLALASCARSAEPPVGAITVSTVPPHDAQPQGIRVSGLSGSDLRQLTGAGFDDARWSALFAVRVDGNRAAPVSGRYHVTATAIEFAPAFPFEPGRTYEVTFDPARLPVPRPGAAATTAAIQIAGLPAASATRVTRIDPTAAVWPENMLRFYVHFSAPMSRGQGTRHVHLLDESGEEVPDAILAAYADLWNDDATRLTVFFDPGRVKRGVGPNVSMGRAIVRGRRYTIAVDDGWPDAHGQPIVGPFRQTFTAGPAAYRALSAAEWQITPPAGGTRQPVRLRFPQPLDRALLDRAIAVRGPSGALAGRIAVDAGETNWRFTPDAAWAAGEYRIVVSAILEDPAGNRLGRPFETLQSADVQPARDDEDVELPFIVPAR